MIAENLNATQDDGLDDVKLLNAKALAGCLSVSLRQLHRMNKAKVIPGPVTLGRCVRWRLTEISDWLAAGSPSREEWESMQRAKTKA